MCTNPPPNHRLPMLFCQHILACDHSTTTLLMHMRGWTSPPFPHQLACTCVPHHATHAGTTAPHCISPLICSHPAMLPLLAQSHAGMPATLLFPATTASINGVHRCQQTPPPLQAQARILQPCSHWYSAPADTYTPCHTATVAGMSKQAQIPLPLPQ